MNTTEIITAGFMLFGAVLIFIAGIGIVRMPDLFLRMSATSKAATLGVGLVLVAPAVYFGELSIISRAVVIFLFILATAPVSSHMIGRSAYSNGVPLWSGTKYDQLRGRYDHQRRIVTSQETVSPPAEPPAALD